MEVFFIEYETYNGYITVAEIEAADKQQAIERLCYAKKVFWVKTQNEILREIESKLLK